MSIVRPTILPPIIQPIRGPFGSSMPWESSGGGVAWTPVALGSKLKLWLDQRDQVVTGAGVSDWGDQSTAGTMDLSQTIDASRPPSGQTINGWAAPDGDGVADYMLGPNLVGGDGYTSASASRILCVIDNGGETPGADNANSYLEPGVFALGSTAGWLGLAWSVSGPRVFGFDGAFKVTARMSATVGACLIDISHDGVTLSARRGADSAVTVACAALTTPGTRARFFCNYSIAAFFAGRIGSIIMCNAALTAGEESAVRAYLGAKYGVAV